MIETDFQYYCQDCSRIAPEAKISKFFGGDEPIFAEYMDRVYPCEKNDNKNYPETKAKIGFEI